MTLILQHNVVGQARGAGILLRSRRRRLSTIARRHAPIGRPYIVSVHRRGEPAYAPTDRSVRLRASWAKTLVGPQDVVLITILPLGGRSGGGGKAGIGLALASIALIALAGPAGGALAGTLGAAGALAVQVGMVVGGIALSYAAQLANSAKKADKTQPNYSVTGGGNIPKPGQRKPLQYGKCWSTPPLSQSDFTIYAGPQMFLYKRITLGIGEYQVHQVRIGDALYWDETSGLQPPFNVSDADPAKSAAIELLYEQTSYIVPGDVVSSPDVTGQELPRAGANPGWTPWFRVSPVGVEVDQIQLDYQWPAGLVHNATKGQEPCLGRINFRARRIDPVTGAPTGEEFELWDVEHAAKTTTAIRETKLIPLEASGCFEVKAQNYYPAQDDYENRATWDGLRGWINDIRIRPKTTEIAMRVPAGQGLTITAFSDVQVLATRKVPIWDGTSWSAPQPTSKVVWAFCDLVRNEYGLDLPAGVDAEKALYYVENAAAFGIEGRDTYDGVLPEVSSFWEAAAELLHPLRADPVKIGTVHTFVRDESETASRHVISRRQVVLDSGQASYEFVQNGGDGSDVIVEFMWGGDPKRPGEVRYSYGPRTRTPKRYKVAGIVDGNHALHHAKWLAAIAVFRGSTRKVTTEWDGRLVSPGDHILCDLWFLKGKAAAGVLALSANLVLTVDADLPQLGECWASIRLRTGREWGSNGTSLLRATVLSRRTLQLNAADAAAITGLTGRSVAEILALDTQDPTTIVLGDELTELQETYLARSAIPADEDHVTIEMVLDDTRVWQILGETINVPQPPSGAFEDPLVPTISTLHARCERIETTIEVIWSVTPARGATNYEVVLSYDNGVTWEALYTGPVANGRDAIHQCDNPMTIGARAYGRTGLPGEWVYVPFTTTNPVLRGEFLEDDSVRIEKLAAQVRNDIADINRVGQSAIAQFGDLGQATIRDAIKLLDDKLESLANAAATIEGNSYYQRSLIKVQVQSNFAAIEEEREVRVSQSEATARVTNSLGSRLTNAEGTIVGQAAAITQTQTLVTSLNGTVTAQATQITSLGSRVGTVEGQISGQATAVQSLSTRVTLAEGSITATSTSLIALQSTVTVQGGQLTAQANAATQLETRVTGTETSITAQASAITALQSVVGSDAQASAIQALQTSVSSINGTLSAVSSSTTALQTTIGQHSSTLTTYGESIDGIKARYGVALAFNNAVGGFVISGWQDLAGNATITAGFDVQAFVITNGQTSKTPFSIIDDKVFISDLVVANANILAGAVSQALSAVGSSGNPADLYIQPKRPGSKIIVLATYSGTEAYDQYVAGTFVIYRNGSEISRAAVGAERITVGGTNVARLSSATCFGLYQSPADNPVVHFSTGNSSTTAGQGNSVLLAIELSA